MTLATDFDRLFVEGFAQLLANAAIGLSFSTSADYAAADGIYVPSAPADTPGRCVWLASYWLGDDAALADSTRGLQVGVRSAGVDLRPAQLLDDTIFNTLAGLFGFTLPTAVAVSSFERTSATSWMQEDGGRKRWWRTSGYTALLNRPSANRH